MNRNIGYGNPYKGENRVGNNNPQSFPNITRLFPPVWHFHSIHNGFSALSKGHGSPPPRLRHLLWIHWKLNKMADGIKVSGWLNR